MFIISVILILVFFFYKRHSYGINNYFKHLFLSLILIYIVVKTESTYAPEFPAETTVKKS